MSTSEEMLKKLRLARGQLKGTVTRIENFINDPISLASASIEMIQARLEKLNTTFKDYERTQLDILTFDEKDKENVAVLEDKYFIIISKLKSALKSLSTTEMQQCTNVSTSKLPNIDVPIFNGKDFTKYTPFIELFTAVIDKNKSLSDVQKLFYLRKFLADEALAVIVNLPLINESYNEALNLLKRRYDNKSRLIFNHINILLQLTVIQKGTAASIRSFVSQVQQQLHALKNLEQPVNQWDMLLISILSKKLDSYTNRAYQLDRNTEVLPTMEEFISFLERRAIALEDSSNSDNMKNAVQKVTNVVTKKYNSCTYCEGMAHMLHSCPKFKLASLEDRLKFIDAKKLCIICLKAHTGKCKFSFVCKLCKEAHNTLLHKDSCPEPQAAVSLHSNAISNKTLLPTIKVKLIDHYGSEFFVRALLDSGSQASFITSQLVSKLNLIPKIHNANVIGLGNINNKINKYVEVTIGSPVNNTQLEVECHVVDVITVDLPQYQIDITNLNIPSHIKLSDNNFNVPTEISMLLGADIYFNILIEGQIKIHNHLLLQNTLFGYTIGGNIACLNNKHNNNFVANLAICDSEKLENVMEQFWLAEMIPQPVTRACTEFQKAEKCFQQSVKLVNNRFFVDMPLTSEIQDLQLGDSFSVALQRFLSLEKRFKCNPLYLEKYKRFIEEYLALGHAKKVDIGDYDLQGGAVYFFAHHAVLNEESLTTKLRVVFDGSMKSRSGLSLNDVMLNGPVVQSELFDILLLWRTFTYTLTCDIQKMFRGIFINPEQTCLQNILWRDDPSKPISCLQLQTVTYGLKASTFLATHCLIELANRYKSQFPLAAQAMLYSTYCDDIICGSDDIIGLCQLKNELIDLLGKGSFTLHKWCSNIPQAIHDIPNEHKYFQKLDINKDNIVKTLGLKCDVLNDTFTFTCPMVNNDDNKTKRSILSFIGKMFDPLGLIGPIIVTAKLFMQTLWSLKIDWDKCLHPEQFDYWNRFLKNLTSMGTLTVPRCVSSQDIVIIELIGYADASMKAFGSCLYLRIIDSDGNVFVNLLCSKSRVAPLNKTLTIPRLELNSALLLSQIANRVHNILKTKFSTLTVYLYSDSQITLAWIKSKNLKSNPYVYNRVNQIKHLTSKFKWSHVSTSNNPADLLSRGCDPHKLKLNELWWHGPKELSNKDFRHSVSDIMLPIPSLAETEVVVNLCDVCEQSPKDLVLYELVSKISEFNKLQRVVAYVLRFTHNCLKNSDKVTGALTPQELHNALTLIICCVQRKYFSKEIDCLKNSLCIKTGLARLHPFLDNAGVLRVGGRLQNAVNLSYDRMHPIILPKSCHFTDILISREHLRLLHAGAKLVLSSLSQKYWLISGIREVKKVVNKCVKCFRLKAAAAKQLMGSLPQERLSAVRPFNIVGVDFCGPFSVKVSRIRKPLITKGYVALFVCFSTKAIHMELVSDLTTDAFLACLKRFIARRGIPVKIFCDNAKTFKGAANELKELYKLFLSKSHVDSINNYCTSNFIKFKFIPSYSPEFGGLWEAGVKSFKYHFKRIVGNIVLTFEALYTVITEIEAVLNSRPLLPLSSDISSFEYLTPGHFLIGKSMMSYPEPDLCNHSINKLQFWDILCKIKQDIWKVWSRNYLTQLQSRPKWHHVNQNLAEGDLVIVRSDNTPPLTWPMARIIRTVPGPDGIVRVAEIKMPNGKIYTRTLRKLCPLPLN